MNITVNPGFSVVTPKKTFQPGESLEVDDNEARRLIDAKIVTAAGEAASGDKGGGPLNVTKTVELVVAVQTIEDLDKLAEGETRKGVTDAIAKRRAELTTPAE